MNYAHSDEGIAATDIGEQYLQGDLQYVVALQLLQEKAKMTLAQAKSFLSNLVNEGDG